MTNIDNWIIGTVAIIGSCTALALLVKNCRKKRYPEYLKDCIKKAQSQFVASSEIKKTILVLEKVSEDTISAFFYRSYNDGKIRKEEIQSTKYRLSLCPEDVIKKILDKNCIVKTY